VSRAFVAKAAECGLADGLHRQLAPAQAAVAEVERHPVEPWHGRDVEAERLAMAVRPQERVLEDFLGRVGIPRQRQRRALDERPMAPEEGLERVEVVALHPY